MARLSKLPNLSAILNAAQHWKQRCLVGDGSVLSNSELWSQTNLALLDQYFIQAPMVGAARFLEKFGIQLEATPGPAKQLAAEMLWLLLLFPSNIKGDTKRQNVMTVWSWSGETLDPANDLLSILDYGIGSGGQAFNTLRPWELTFLIVLMQRWKREPADRKAILLGDPWELGNWLDTTPDGNKRQFRHMLLYLLFPESYERISSTGQKNKIGAAFASLAGLDEFGGAASSDSPGVALDKRLLRIRKVLEKQHPDREIDFYDPELEIQWQPEPDDIEDVTCLD
jgi:5-methylcytosine-specific restriction protein B